MAQLLNFVTTLTSDPRRVFRDSQAISRLHDEGAHTVPRGQESGWNGAIHEHQR